MTAAILAAPVDSRSTLACMRRRSSDSLRMPAAEGFEGVFVQGGFVEKSLWLRGFSAEWHR